jgi:mRNA interferase YafQ
MLNAEFTPQFERDSKKLAKKHVDLSPLKSLVNLILLDTDEAKSELLRRHNMHSLKGEWLGSHECHVANAGDWLVVWRADDKLAVFQRTGSHDDIFK